MTSYQILPMCAAHIPQIAALERQSFSAPWDAASLTGELTNPLSVWLAALEEERVLGYVGSQTVFEDTDILNLAVRPESRRRGIAEALMGELERQLRDRGTERVTLEVRASNAPAAALYEKLGYARVGLRRGYYEKPREDALILQKKLVQEHEDPIH